MTIAASPSTSAEEFETALPPEQVEADTADDAFFGAQLPDDYEIIRGNEDIQFTPLEMKVVEPREPSWLEEWLNGFFEWLGEVLGPLGQMIGASWPVLKWALLAALVLFVIYCVVRFIGPLAERQRSANAAAEEEPDWQPDRAESLALLEDADQLAAQGRYDEAARLLLKRSVGQIAAARPDWVEPSSTARELATLPRLSAAARTAFATISEAVERSLFALKSLTREDWERARAAYADFALSRIEARDQSPTEMAA